MKWGRNKSSSSSSPSSSRSISRVFLISWLSKFGRKNATKTRENGKQNLGSPLSPQRDSLKQSRFYSADNDQYWRLLFGEERFEGVKKRGGSRFIWNDSDDELDVPMPSSRSFNSRARELAGGEENKKRRELPHRGEIFCRNNACHERSCRQSAMEGKTAELAKKSAEKAIFETKSEKITHIKEKGHQKSSPFDSRKQNSISFPSSNPIDCLFEELNMDEAIAFTEEKLSPEKQKETAKKIQEILLKSEKQRKSIHISRGSPKGKTKQGSKVRVYSPRTGTKIECKIKALDDMKKAKTKMKIKIKKKSDGKVVEERTAYDSCAVLKCSFDPQQDFRNSMIEMITAKDISQPEELEELLACYLMFNCNEYHDLIIKVFRQVWFELNQMHVVHDFENEN